MSAADGTAGWASGTGRGIPGSTGFGAMKAPLRNAALSTASAGGGGAAGGSGRASLRGIGGAAFCVSIG
jgi:hypothetical protein